MGSDDNSKSIDNARDGLLLKLLSIAVNVNQLLQEEIERRAQLEEELELNSEQLAFLEFDYEWDFSRKWR